MAIADLFVRSTRERIDPNLLTPLPFGMRFIFRDQLQIALSETSVALQAGFLAIYPLSRSLRVPGITPKLDAKSPGIYPGGTALPVLKTKIVASTSALTLLHRAFSWKFRLWVFESAISFRGSPNKADRNTTHPD